MQFNDGMLTGFMFHQHQVNGMHKEAVIKAVTNALAGGAKPFMQQHGARVLPKAQSAAPAMNVVNPPVNTVMGQAATGVAMDQAGKGMQRGWQAANEGFVRANVEGAHALTNLSKKVAPPEGATGLVASARNQAAGTLDNLADTVHQGGLAVPGQTPASQVGRELKGVAMAGRPGLVGSALHLAGGNPEPLVNWGLMQAMPKATEYAAYGASRLAEGVPSAARAATRRVREFSPSGRVTNRLDAKSFPVGKDEVGILPDDLSSIVQELAGRRRTA